MKPQLLIPRRRPHVIATRQHGTWAWPVLGTLAVVSLFALAGHLDAQAELQQLAELRQRRAELDNAFQAGVQLGHAQMIDSATAAWRAAQNEAEHCARKAP